MSGDGVKYRWRFDKSRDKKQQSCKAIDQERQKNVEIQSYILYEDRDLIVCRKPPGVPVQTKQIQTKDMVSLLKNYRYQQEGGKEEPILG